MNEKDELILEMLKKGKSYADIIADLSVSPSRISVVKKKNVDILKDLSGVPYSKYNKDECILEMLKKGKSYADIIADLSVSPSSISVVKKRNADILKSVTGLLHSNTIEALPAQEPEENVVEPVPTDTDKFEIPEKFRKRLEGIVFANELGVIKRYIRLDGKEVDAYYLFVFIKDLQFLIKSREIRKDSKYVKEIMHIQKELIKIWEKHQGTKDRFVFKLDNRDKFIRTAYKK